MSEHDRATELDYQHSDHDLLIRIDTRLETLSADLKEFKGRADRELTRLWDEKASIEEYRKCFNNCSMLNNDHESRLRKVERTFWVGAGALGVLQLAIGLWLHYSHVAVAVTK